MSPARLLEHFDRLIDTPDAVPRLRRFILDLAVRGKLVEQDPKDEPAGELLKRIQAEKARLVKEGSQRQQESQTLAGEDIPFDLPAGWEWTQLAEIGVVNPRCEADDTTDASFVPMPMISAKYGEAHEHEVRQWAEIKKGFTRFGEGDVGLAKITPCFENGKSTVFRGLTGGLGAGTTELHVLRPVLVSADYILVFLKSSHFIGTGIPKMTGTAGQKRVPREYFAFSPFPLPPLAEQHRIVVKVDELMALCDELEAAQTKRERRRDRLVAATLHGLNNGAATPTSAAPATFEESARFYFNHLPRLITRPEHIHQLRQTILNLAFCGKLVPQDPEDEPASALRDKHLVEREKLLSAGEIRGRDRLPPIQVSETPFSLPNGWTWIRMGELVLDADSGWSPKCEDFPRAGNSWGVIKVSAVSWDRFLPEENKQLLSGVEPRESARIRQGDFLISRANTSELVAKCVVVKEALTNLMLSDKIVRLRLVGPLNRVFLSLVNNHLDYARAHYASKASGTSLSMKNVSRDIICSLPVPLPPLAEQHRIVAKVDELMGLCDEMENGIVVTATSRDQILTASLLEAIARPTHKREPPGGVSGVYRRTWAPLAPTSEA